MTRYQTTPRHATRKRTAAAKAETKRRRDVRREKYTPAS